MTDGVHVQKQEGPTGGRYVARIDGAEAEATLACTVRSAGLVSADHTEAPESLRGTGAALALVERMVADARATGFRIVPLCPYVLAQSKRRPDWSDVIA